MQKMHIPKSDKPVVYYNLDVIISVGYRVKSKRGVQFRQWATKRLKEYLVDGYAINQKRLEERNLELQHLKTGIAILRRAIAHQAQNLDDVEHKKAFVYRRKQTDCCGLLEANCEVRDESGALAAISRQIARFRLQ